MFFSIIKLPVFVKHLSIPGNMPALHAAAIGFTCRLLDGEDWDDLQPQFVTAVNRRLSRLTNLSDPARVLGLHNPTQIFR